MLELLEALEEFLRERLDASTDRFDRFQFLVAANTVAILQREVSHSEESDLHEWTSLDALLGEETLPALAVERAAMLNERNADLCERIEMGEFEGEAEHALLRHLYETTRNKVLIANPREAE